MTTAEAKAVVFFDNPCEDPFEFGVTEQTNPAPGKYSGEDIVFTLNQFHIVPDKCKVRYGCFNVERVDGAPSDISCTDLTFDGEMNFQPTDGILTFNATPDDYINQTYLPGEYRVTIIGIAYQALVFTSYNVNFVMTLLDPCDPPESLMISADFVNQEYVITDNEKSYTHPAVVIAPAFCPFSYEWSETLLSDGSSAVK